MNRKRIFSHWLKRKLRRADSAGPRFFDQFDTKLRFRELEPRVVLNATATVSVDNVLQIESDASDQVTVEYYDNAGVTYYKVTDQANTLLDDGLASDIEGIEMTDTMGVHAGQQLTLLDNSTLIDPSLGKGLITNGVEVVSFNGSSPGDSWTFATKVSITGDTYNAEVNQSGADLLTPAMTPVSFAAINGATIDVTLDSPANEISLLNVSQGGDIKVTTAADISLDQVQAQSIELISAKSITNQANALVEVANNASFAGASVTLGNQAGDDLAFGSLAFDSGGIVTIAEDADTLLTGTSKADSLTLSSTGKIENSAGAELKVANNALFAATDGLANGNNQITLGQNGTDDFEFGSLTFNTVDAVKIAETGDTTLAGMSTAGSLELKSTGSISDASMASVVVSGPATFAATNDITLTDEASNTLQVDGQATFSAGGAIDIGPAGVAKFGSLNFSGAAVTIQEDDDTLLTGSNLASSLDLKSTGSISDAANTQIDINGPAILGAGTTIALNDDALDTLEVDGLATFKAGASLDIGAAGLATFGSLNFSGGAVTIQEGDDTLLAGKNAATSLDLSSTGKLENSAGAELKVTNNASFTADDGDAMNGNNQITLGQGEGDDFEFGSLTFNTVDAVKIAETGDTSLAGMSTAESLVLKSTGAITNEMNAKLTVAMNAGFSAATDITLGHQIGDQLMLGTLTFNGQMVSIAEDDSTNLSGISSADSLVLDAFGSIQNEAGAQLSVKNNAQFLALTDVALGGQAGDKMKFGSLTFDGDLVSIAEDDDTLLTGVNAAASLDLSSTGKIENSAGTELKVTGNASFTADDGLANVNNQITLGQDGTDDFEFGSLTFNTVDAVMIAVTGKALLSGKSNADSLVLGSTGSIQNEANAKLFVTQNAKFVAGSSIALGNETSDLIQLGSLTFSSKFGVSVREDGDTKLSGVSQAATLFLHSTGSIANEANAELKVSFVAQFAADDGDAKNANNQITLGDQAGDKFQFASLNFNSVDAVSIAEDSDMLLEGNNTAGSLTLDSTGKIENKANTHLSATGDVMLIAGTDITIGAETNDLITFGSLNFSGDAITIEEDDGTLLTGKNAATSLDLSSTGKIENTAGAELKVTNNASFTATDGLANGNNQITLGQGVGDDFEFGSLTFNTVDAVKFTETGDTTLDGMSTAGSLELKSTGSIFDAAMAAVVVTGAATFTATNGITLVDEASNTLQVDGLATFNAGAAIDIGPAGMAKFGSLNFSGGAVTIQEDDDTLLTGSNLASSLDLKSTGSISDAANTQIDINGPATFGAGTTIALTDDALDTLEVDGLATFTAVASIDIGPAGLAKFGSLQFSGTAVTIHEVNDTQLTGISAATSLDLSSTGKIENTAGAELKVTNNASFTATDGLANGNNQITLGQGVGDDFEFGSLAFNSVDVVKIAETGNTLLTGASSAGALFLNATGKIENAIGAELKVTNNASFTATDGLANGNNQITLGQDGTDDFEFGSLTFNTVDAVKITETGDTTLVGMSTAGSLELKSTGSILDASMASVVISGPATFTATKGITLTDEASNTLQVDGLATFKAGTSIDIGPAGVAKFGSLNFSGAAVTIQEDGDTLLTGANLASSLDLKSTGSITDAANTQIDINGLAIFEAATTIGLADDAMDALEVDGLATFHAGSSIDIGPAGLATFGSLNFSGGAVTIQEDDDTLLTGSNLAASLNLRSAGSITDAANTQIDINGPATFEATTTIALNDDALDTLEVDGLATFHAGGSIAIGPAGLATFGSLQFSGAAVTIQEDDATILTGMNTATSLDLQSAGSLTDAAMTSVVVTGPASFTAADVITLANEMGDTLQVDGRATFVSSVGKAIEMGVDNSINRGDDSGATVLLGQLTFVSDNGMNVRDSVTIREDSDMEVTGVNLAADLFLAADGSIIQVEDGDALTADRIDLDIFGDGVVVGNAVLEAAAGKVINLFGDTAANPLGEPVSTFLADNKIAGAEFRATGGGDLSDVYFRNISTAASFPILPGTVTGDLRIQFTAADMIIDDDINVGDQLILEALGTLNSISDVDGVSIIATDAIIVADGTITLADEANNVLKIGVAADDNAFFYSRAGKAITVGASDADGTASGATVELASLTFFSSDAVTTRGEVVIHETDSTLLASRRFDLDGSPVIFINRADSLVLISDGDLTDADSDGSLNENILRASVDVANSSTMIAGGEIHLADQTLITVDSADLGVYSLGLNDGVLDNDIALFATTGGGNIRVGVSDILATDSGASVKVDGLTFNTTAGMGSVYLQTDSETRLANRDFAGTAYENLANDLVLRTTGLIGSAGGEKTSVIGDARFLASDEIQLVNSDANAQLLVGKNAFFQSGGAVTVGAGTSGVNFGTLTFDAIGAIMITESNASGGFIAPAAGMTIINTTFAGGSTNHALSATLVSDTFIADDAATTILVDTFATLTADTTITLGDNVGDKLIVKGDASFTSTGGQQIDIGVTPTMKLATDRGTDSGATVELGSLQFKSVGGDVTVHEDLGMLLAGTSQADTLVLVTSKGDIRDRTNTKLTVTDVAEFHAEMDVVLADQKTDELTVIGNALFTSGNTNYFATPGVIREISVGVVDVDSANNPNVAGRGTDSGAMVSLRSVTFFGFANMDAGAHVTIREDASMVISHAERREGGGATEITNFAQTALLIADNGADTATITDSQIDAVGGTLIKTTDFAIFQADSSIVLANEAADVFTIGGNAYFASQLDNVELGVLAKSVNALDRGADSGASVQLGTLTFQATLGDVTIHEDGDTTLTNGNPLRETGSAANSLVLESSGSIDDTAGTSLLIAQLVTAPVVGSAEDQVDGLAILRAAADIHLGDSPGDSIDLRRLSLTVGGDVSITETSASDGGLLLVDGSQTTGTMAIKTSGHLVQINDERTGAAFSTIVADQALLVAGGAIVMTNVDFNQATLQAHGTLQVTPGAALNTTDAANGGLLGRRTTDSISGYLPDSNDDTFAPKGPSTTPATQTNMDGVYSVVLSDVNSLTLELVTDSLGTIAADPVTLAFEVANSDDMAIANFTPALSAVGVSAGHMFVQTVGDLTFAEQAADPLDNVVVYGEVRMTGGATTNNAFTALAGGTLNIAGDSMLVMRSAADFYLFNDANNTLTPFVGGGLADSIGSLGAVSSFATFVDVDTQPGFIQVGEFGPIYQRTPQSADPNASTSQIAKGLGNGQFQVNATITKLGDASTINVDGQPVYVEQNFRVLVDWGDGSQDIYLFQDPIDGAQTLQHAYSSGFANAEQRATVTITAFNDPQINLYDNVVDDTTFRDLNSVTDTFEVVFPLGVQFAPEPPPFTQPSAPEIAPVALLPESVFAVTTNSAINADGGSLNQIQEVVVVIVNALDEEVGERVVLQGFSTIEEVKQYIQESTRFLPGRYKVSILLAGQQEPEVYYFEKVAGDAPDGSSSGAADGGGFEGHVQSTSPDLPPDASAEQVWAVQYEKWFETDDASSGDELSPEAVDAWTPDLSAVLQREELLEAREEQSSLRRRWMLPGGIGGALMMAAFALNPQSDRQRADAVDEALEKEAQQPSESKQSLSRRRWRRRVR